MNFKYYKTGALIPFFIVLVILCAIISHRLLESLKSSPAVIEINDNIHIISTLSLIIFILGFINFFAWKWWVFKWLIDIPDLNGRYVGELISSYLDPSGNPTIKDCAFEIKQSASSIHIFSYYGDKGSNTQTSRAYSVSEELVQEKDGLFQLYYIYTNEPDALLTKLNNHAGTAKLKYHPDIKSLIGDYYNQRRNIGTINVKFQKNKKLGRLV